jgi:hypothetical protein
MVEDVGTLVGSVVTDTGSADDGCLKVHVHFACPSSILELPSLPQCSKLVVDIFAVETGQFLRSELLEQPVS